MFIKDEQWYEDLEKSKFNRTITDPEEDSAYAHIINKGEMQ